MIYIEYMIKITDGGSLFFEQSRFNRERREVTQGKFSTSLRFARTIRLVIMSHLQIAYIFLAFLVFFAKVLPASAASLTVCASGCNVTSIQTAVDIASPGNDILVKNGSYSGVTINKMVILTGENIDANDPRNNGATINGQVIVTGNFTFGQEPLVKGFRIIGGTDPVVIQNSVMTIENSYIKGTGGDGVSINTGGAIIRGNRIESGGDDGIDVDSQNKSVIIENNYIVFSGQDGIEIRQQPVTLASRISMWIRGNRIEGSGEDGLQIMDYGNFSNRKYVIERNLFLYNTKAAIGLNIGQNTNQSYEAAPMPEPLYAVNNTFFQNDAGISGGANLIAINNIFTGQNTFDLKNVTGKSVVKHSFFSATPHLVGVNNFDNSTTQIGNPMLDASYFLQPGSPAIDRGIPSYQHTYNYDGSGGGSAQTVTEFAINLNSSQYTGSAPDLGWKESGMVGNTPTPTPQGPTATRTPTPIPGVPTATRTPTPRPGTPTPTPRQGMCVFWRRYGN